MRKLFTFGLFASTLIATALFSADASPKVVKLTPPKLSKKTINEKIVCTRPMREGKFNISTELLNGKRIVHIYGHGGSGWTTLFGSVMKGIELFEKTNPSKDTPIRVVGSGCMGLTTAIELTRLGYQVKGITTKSLIDMPSWRAAGYFALVSVKTSPEEQANLNEIGMNTFLTYQQIDQGQHPYIHKKCVRFLPVYCSEDTDSGVEDLEARGMIPPREYVTLDFGNGAVNPGYVKFMTYFMDTTALMRQLGKEVNRLKIPITIKEVKSFDDVSEEIVFNCTGLGSRELCNDQNLIPVRGHLVTLDTDSGKDHLNYMIYSKVKQDGKEEYIYMFPKNYSITPENVKGTRCAGVLGGTFIPNVDKLPPAEQQQLDEKEFQRMLDRNAIFFTGKPFKK